MANGYYGLTDFHCDYHIFHYKTILNSQCIQIEVNKAFCFTPYEAKLHKKAKVQKLPLSSGQKLCRCLSQ